jgi:hypothetical protein
MDVRSTAVDGRSRRGRPGASPPEAERPLKKTAYFDHFNDT